MAVTRQEANEFRLISDDCDNQRDILDGALNRMHLAKTYEELENWYDWSKIHLRELDKLLHRKVQFLTEHSKQGKGGEE